MQGKHYPLIRIPLSDSSHRMNGRGFTLIEILVTLVLISIILGIALLRFDDHDFDALLRQEVGRMARVMELADQQAIYQSQDIGMLIKEDSYSFLQYTKEIKDGKETKESQWVPVDDDLLKPRQFLEEMEIIVDIEGNNADLRGSLSDKPVPQIVFSNSGEWTAFEIILTHRGNNDITYILNTAENGELEITRESNELQ